MMKKRTVKIDLSCLKSLILFGLVVFLFGFSARRNNRKKIKETPVEFSNGDNLFLTHETVDKLLIQKNGVLKNKVKTLINLQELESEVCSNKRVAHAKVYMTIDGSLRTVVTQRTPIARIQTDQELYYLDNQGCKMPLSTNYSAPVLLVSGWVGAFDLVVVYELVRSVQENPFLKENIIGIQALTQGRFVLKTRLYDQHILIGSVSNLKSKLKKLDAFYNKVIHDKQVETYKTIDVRYENQVVCTKK